MATELVKSARYSIWYRLLQLFAKTTGKVPSFLIGRTYITIKYNDGTVTKVKIS